MKNLIENYGSTMKIVIGILFIVVAIVLVFIAYKHEKSRSKNSSPVKKMTALAILSALSVLLYYFIKIPMSVFLPFMPPFLDIHFSAVPIYIAGFMFGPLSGTIVSVMRFLIKLPNSSTLGVGELADLIIALFTVITAATIYHRNKSKKAAIKALTASVFVWMLVGILSNWLVTLPFYIELYRFDAVFGMLSVIPGITEANFMLYYLIIAVIPFNLILSSLVSGITYLVYKRISVAYDKFDLKESYSKNHNEVK